YSASVAFAGRTSRIGPCRCRTTWTRSLRRSKSSRRREADEMKTRLAINGACGRMGQRLVALSREDSEFDIVAAMDWSKHPSQGRDAGELAGVGSIGVA